MNTAEFIRIAWPLLIKATNNPVAPIIIQDAFGKVDTLGKMLAQRADKSKVHEYVEVLLYNWTEEESEEVSGSPEFIVALSGMLCQSLLKYVQLVTKDGT